MKFSYASPTPCTWPEGGDVQHACDWLQSSTQPEGGNVQHACTWLQPSTRPEGGDVRHACDWLRSTTWPEGGNVQHGCGPPNGLEGAMFSMPVHVVQQPSSPASHLGHPGSPTLTFWQVALKSILSSNLPCCPGMLPVLCSKRLTRF